MLTIRLQRVGRKNEPTFRLVLTDSKNGPKSGKALEVLGSYDSRHGDKALFEGEKIKHWISKGAKPSDTVHNLLVSRKIIDGKKINVLPLKRAIKKDDEGSPEGASSPSEVPKNEAAREVSEVAEVSAETEAVQEDAPAEKEVHVDEPVKEAAEAPKAE